MNTASSSSAENRSSANSEFPWQTISFSLAAMALVWGTNVTIVFWHGSNVRTSIVELMDARVAGIETKISHAESSITRLEVKMDGLINQEWIGNLDGLILGRTGTAPITS